MIFLIAFLASAASVSGLFLGVSRANLYTYPPGILLEDESEYDFIVVGAGAAGSAAAARLALAGHDVLLLEAGGDPDPISKIPSASMGLLGSPIDWQYKTLPNNKSCLSMRGRQCHFNRGKCLGGSTTINYMQYTRGSRCDYDNIGVPGWTWKDLKPYFLRYEGLQVLDKFPRSSIPYHNTSGLMKIEYFDDPQIPWRGRFIEGMMALNYPYNRDVNGRTQIGVSKIVGYVYEAERMSTARGYLARDDVKTKLKVAKHAYCTGVIIGKGNVAQGVTVVQNNVTYRIYARREVILSAGAVGTPQILQLSGIGPADHLRQMGIPVRVDLTVGNDMSDHVLPLMLILVDKNASIIGDLQEVAGAAISFGQYIISRTGRLASNGITDVLAFSNMDCYDEETRRLQTNGSCCELPSLQLICAYIDRKLLQLGKPFFQNAINFNDDVIDQISEVNGDYAIIVMSPIILQPHSRGNIRLASSDPQQPPAIFPNYLGDSRDVDAMLKAITVVEHLVETPPFKQNNASIFHIRLPCPSIETDKAGYWRCYVRHMTYAVFHAAGTCALGRVLDGELRVRGVRRLRVADLSALPYVPRGNTEAVTIAIGERVVDFVLQDISNS
ncbi:glucose dehydrogenase [FAD, quinone] [Manduca sexta]|uniref:glucose dehydrogenase [FAD, quinone] n=1 Tax=Manduca sexta TaxID=7130 RepID=UPI001182FB0D|nr:glucose dehydrogenase [FAD, quinone] [Manduca sexta]